MNDYSDCCLLDANFRPIGCTELADGPRVNIAPFGALPPGTVKIGTAKQNRNGTWTISFEYRPEGWEDKSEEVVP